jgi:hypothetical protein
VAGFNIGSRGEVPGKRKPVTRKKIIIALMDPKTKYVGSKICFLLIYTMKYLCYILHV